MYFQESKAKLLAPDEPNESMSKSEKSDQLQGNTERFEEVSRRATKSDPVAQIADAVSQLSHERMDVEWLSSRSKDELIAIIVGLKAKLPKTTDKLPAEVAKKDIGTPALDTRVDADSLEYIELPANPVHIREELAHSPWRIRLIPADSKVKHYNLEIRSDVFVGRAVAGIKPDVDLTESDAQNLVISRQHAFLRPTKKSLLLVDLGSTNGTFCNSKRLEEGVPHKLGDKDVVTFGNLDFQIRIVKKPTK